MMKTQKRIRDYGIQIGKLPTGEKNRITDVPGLKVGHVTLQQGDVNTGVTAILPHDGNMFQNKVVAASHVITQQLLNENHIDHFFRAVAEATEEAVLNAMVCAMPLEGRKGHTRRSLAQFL